ncbi:MAG: hypothetical protein KatS3mg114_0098 [Planctomycetaceae bacterium]|nr:MAG: hypothetical protein KatS3mg114_0098 [Planctomycetaceae bacterium]
MPDRPEEVDHAHLPGLGHEFAILHAPALLEQSLEFSARVAF